MSKALELADKLDDTPNWQKEKWGSQWKHSTLVFSRDPFEAAAELRRLAAVEANQAELLEVLQEIYETLAWDHLPPFKRDIADRARAAIAKATGETE